MELLNFENPDPRNSCESWNGRLIGQFVTISVPPGDRDILSLFRTARMRNEANYSAFEFY